MQGYIHVYIKDKHIEVMGQEFLLGELSLSLMNISQEQINKIRPLHSKIEQLAGINRFEHLFYRHILHTDKQRKLELAADRLIKLPTFSEWTEIHKAVCDMVDMLREIKIFEVLLNPIDKNYIEQYSSFEYNSEEYNFAWLCYLELVDIITGYFEDAVAFARTITNFADVILAGLKSLDSHSFSLAYSMFMNEPQFKNLIASPDDKDGLMYTREGFVLLQYIPMPKSKCSNEYCIAEYYKTDNLQAVAKMDFLKGLMKGHHPRRCKQCNRFFLMTRGYRTIYCDKPSLENPKFTCSQVAYKQIRRKEENATNPKYLSYRRCVKRIEKCYQRGTLTKEQEKQLIRKAYDIYHVAITSPKYSNNELEELLKSKNLYTQCGITPPKKGRPKGVK